MAHSAITGSLIHGCYLGGVFVAIEHGLSAGMIALVVSLQPVLTSTLANRWLGERVRALQWLGLALGIAGVYLIVRDKATTGGATPFAWAAGVVALVRHHRRHALSKALRRRHRLAAGLFIQYGTALVLFALGAFAFETRVIHWTPQFIFAVAWLVLVLSVGAVWLLLLSHPPERGDTCGQPVLSDAAGDGADGVALVRRAAGAARARWHGGLRRRRVLGELQAARRVGQRQPPPPFT